MRFFTLITFVLLVSSCSDDAVVVPEPPASQWHNVIDPTAQVSMNAISVRDEEHAIAVGNDGAAFLYTGRLWESIDPETPAEVAEATEATQADGVVDASG